MQIRLSLSPAPSVTNDLVVAIYNTLASGTVVAFQEFHPPHTSPRNITFTDVDDATYIVNTYETPGWPVTGQIRHSFIYDPSFQTAESRKPDFITMAEGDPKISVDRTDYTDPSWIGWFIESVERVGMGTQFAPENITYHALQPDGTTDGFSLSAGGDTFQPDEKWVVRFLPQISIQTPTVNSVKLITGDRIVTSSETLTSADAGIGLRIQGATQALTLILPPAGGVTPYTTFVFFSSGGSHINCQIQTDGADVIEYQAAFTPHIILGQGESIKLLSNGSTWLMDGELKGYEYCGEVVDHYENNRPNTIFAAGQELDRLVYLRLWERAQASGRVIAQSIWNDTSGGQNNKGNYGTGDGSTTFVVPLLYSAGFMRGIDGITRQAGQYAADTVGPHTHPIPTAPNDFTGGTLAYARGGTPISPISTSANTGTTETAPKNFGIYKLIRI